MGLEDNLESVEGRSQPESLFGKAGTGIVLYVCRHEKELSHRPIDDFEVEVGPPGCYVEDPARRHLAEPTFPNCADHDANPWFLHNGLVRHLSAYRLRGLP